MRTGYTTEQSAKLQPRNVQIWFDRYGGVGMTLKAIGIKHSLSPERVRQIVARIDRRLTIMGGE